MSRYRIFTDATADLGLRAVESPLPVTVIPMEVEIGGQAYTYGPGGTLFPGEFYAMQRAGKYATTSQIAPTVYFQYFEPALREGFDVLYLGFSSGMSGTLQNARLCALELQAQYPERRIVCLDTLCASVGEGLLVREAARRQREGYSLEQLARWATLHRLEINHWFTVDVFDHLRRGGRVSAATAVFGTALQIKPLLLVNGDGTLEVAEKPRGRRQAIRAQMARMEQNWTPETGNLVIVGHGDCPDAAQMLEAAVRRQFPAAVVETAEIGPVIGAHTGPGMLALAYWGEPR